MTTSTIPLSEGSRQVLQELVQQTGQTVAEVLEKALETYRRKVFFEELNAGYAALRANSEAWAEEQEERKLWEATIADGLDSEERWEEDSHCPVTEPGKD